MWTNRDRGDCAGCDPDVRKEKGFYDMGLVWCSEPISDDSRQAARYGYICESLWNHLYNFGKPHKSAELIKAEKHSKEQEAIRELQTRIRAELINGGLEKIAEEARVRSLEQVITKVLGESVNIPDMSFEQITSVRNELQERMYRKKRAKERQEELKTYKSSKTCDRCGGAGRADKWIMTGSVCYKCDGSGKYYK